MALKSVSFQIYDKEKVGVVGRTGSGESAAADDAGADVASCTHTTPLVGM